MPPHQRRIATARAAGGLIVLGGWDAVPADFQSVRPAHKAEENLLGSAVSLTEGMNLIHLAVHISQVLGDFLNRSSIDVFEGGSQFFARVSAFGCDSIEGSEE